jgi:hypothetical protein
MKAEEVTPEVVAAAEQDVKQIGGEGSAAMNARQVARRRLSVLKSLRPTRFAAVV